jgi:hypothetical protein
METLNIGKKMSKELLIWSGPDGINIPAKANLISEIVPYANYLSEKQKNQIVNAFNAGAFDMAAEYAWKKAMTKLKETIATLGMKFIGEILGRDDINDFTPIDNVLTDYSTIILAEQLGVIGNTAALKLRQANELISHYFSGKSDEDIDLITSIGIVKSSIQYILGEQDISIALEFTEFKERLLTESLRIGDIQVDQLLDSPLFYLRTVSSILLSAIKKDKGARLEHALGNFNLILPHIWPKLGENDRWNIGSAYRDVVAEGNTISATGLKSALLKVSGFDYVPENLRSSTFKRAAKTVIETHFAMNNFYNEPSVVRALSSLGTTIPAPALIECIQAYLLVYMGNSYNVSKAAVPIAYEALSNITRDRWFYYFEKVIHNDDIILQNFETSSQISRLSTLLNNLNLADFIDLPKDNQNLYNAIVSNKQSTVKSIALTLYNRIKKK